MTYKYQYLFVLLFIFTSANARPLSELPKHVVYGDNEITLFADYSGREQGLAPVLSNSGSIDSTDYARFRKYYGVPVFLINDTNETIELAHQDGDVYLKLEYQNEDDDWVRAEPHRDSWCGNSYGTRELAPREFVEISGYQSPTLTIIQQTKITKKIRYSLKNNGLHFISNMGSGYVTQRDIENSKFDDMAIRHEDFEFVSNVVLGIGLESLIEPERLRIQRRAVSFLAADRFDDDETRKVLEQALGKYPELTTVIRSTLNLMKN